MLGPVVIFGLAVLNLARGFDTWCGKHYEPLAPRTPPNPSSYFQRPPVSPVPLLDFRCETASSIYLPDDVIHDPPAIIFDANITHDIGSPFDGTPVDELHIMVYQGPRLLLKTIMPALTSGHTATFSLDLLEPSLDPKNIRCTASWGDQSFEHVTEVRCLPHNPWGGSAVKLDRRTGGVKIREAGQVGWTDFLPFGFYDSIDTSETVAGSQWTGVHRWWERTMGFSLLGTQHPKRTNRDRLEVAKRNGYNMIHPVPPSTSYAPDGDSSAIERYFDDAAGLGLKIMYDMRHGFTDLHQVEQQVEQFRSRSNLLVWYIADEPDGPTLPLDSTTRARNLIRRLDPYHPTALCLNCFDHHFSPYVAGTDILLADVYHIAMNPIWSKKWSTEVTSGFGCSGCDECEGNFYDVPSRIGEWRERSRLLGRSRTLPMWIVPQGFDDRGEEFWWRSPTGDEVAVQTVLGLNHGIVGHCAWNADSASRDILGNASLILSHLDGQKRFIVDVAPSRRQVRTDHSGDGARNGLDVSAWTIRHHKGKMETLVMAAQHHYIPLEDQVIFSPLSVGGKVKKVLFGDVKEEEGKVVFRMGRISIAAVILEASVRDEETTLSVEAAGRRVLARLKSEA